MPAALEQPRGEGEGGGMAVGPAPKFAANKPAHTHETRSGLEAHRQSDLDLSMGVGRK